ncbi:MAG TPA: hypothetical protein VKX16_07850 [Chloroflexota bacterium]|nr:hypothetical protein [Chloroflexota bacterium]
MQKRWVLAVAAVLVVAATTGGVAVTSSAKQSTAATQGQPTNTAKVEKGEVTAIVFQSGTLTYRARSDGSPYDVFNRARGTYTELPAEGDRIACGDVLYRVDDHPVLLLCGSTPAYRSLSQGDSGPDVAELNANLVHLGYARRARLDASSDRFSAATASALEKLQFRRGEHQTGSLALGQAVFLPQSVRIATVTGALGGSAQPDSKVLSATSDTLEVQVALDPSQQGEVKKGESVQITLPGNRSAMGRVDRLGRVAQLPAGPNSNAWVATIPAYITLDDPEQARGLDRSPVQVQITTAGVKNALIVPVTALVGKSGGGLAVEVVRAGGRRELVAVRPGLFDDATGLVQVEGSLRAGDRVVVASS